MRLHPGDSVAVYSNGRRYECRIECLLPDAVELRIVNEAQESRPAGSRIAIAQGIPKGDRFEWLIQKATELGAAEIIPLITERTIVRPEKAESRLQRWNEIAENAAGQSENAYPPVINPVMSLDDYVSRTSTGLKLLLHERQSANSLKSILAEYSGEPIAIAVGPEGGWTDEETSKLLSAGFQKVHLGDRILRAETAGLAMLAILQYELGELTSSPPARHTKEEHRVSDTESGKSE